MVAQTRLDNSLGRRRRRNNDCFWATAISRLVSEMGSAADIDKSAALAPAVQLSMTLVYTAFAIGVIRHFWLAYCAESSKLFRS